MLLLELKGMTGNQMFQYAAGKHLQRITGLPLFIDDFQRKAMKWSLDKYFDVPELKPAKVAIAKMLSSDSLNRFWKFYRPENKTYTEACIPWETFSEDVFKVKRITKLRGYLQSSKYFDHDFEFARSLFKLLPQYSDRVEAESERLGVSDNNVCAIHVRQAFDYRQASSGVGHEVLGWSVPASFYDIVISRLPAELRFLVFGDDMDWAKQHLSHLENVEFVAENSPIVDMFLISRCPYKVLSNSTFAWWAGAMDDNRDSTIYSPEFFVGYHKNAWFPPDISVQGWNYVHD